MRGVRRELGLMVRYCTERRHPREASGGEIIGTSEERLDSVPTSLKLGSEDRLWLPAQERPSSLLATFFVSEDQCNSLILLVNVAIRSFTAVRALILLN